MDNNVLVSIIIPVYNVEKYVGQCLESVLNQTYRNIEVICVYDISEDCSLEVLEEYRHKDERIHIVRNEKRGGLSFARNLGFAQAKGKYTYYLDADDYIELNAIEKLCDYSEEYDTECILFNSKYLVDTVGLGGPSLRYGIKEINKKILDGPTLFKILWENNVYTNSVWRRFWKTSFLVDNDLYFEKELWVAEDSVFSFKALLCGKRVMVVDEYYHVYRRREGAGSTDVTLLIFKCVFKGYCYLLDFWRRCSFQKEVDEVINEYLHGRLISAKRLYMRMKNEISMECFKEGIVQHLFEMLIIQEYKESLDKVDANVLHEIGKFNKVIVYGAQAYAAETVEKLERKGIHVDSLAITKMHELAKGINGIPVCQIDDLCYIKDEAIIVLGVGKQNRDDVIDTLKSLGFNHWLSLD